MVKQIADGVRVYVSEFMQSNAVVVDSDGGVLVVDAGIRSDELAQIAADIRNSGQVVAVGFSTHPHWDHLLWHTGFGSPPRYGTARAAAMIQGRLADPEWKASVVPMLPPDIVDQVPLDDVFGRIIGLPDGAGTVPWSGPAVRVIEHTAHAPGHAALVVEGAGVLVAGDMLSDVLIPMLNPFAPEPIAEYLAALDLFEAVAVDIRVFIPGHGSVGDVAELHRRIALDRAYLRALRDGEVPDDPRLSPTAEFGAAMTGLHTGQVQRLASAAG